LKSKIIRWRHFGRFVRNLYSRCRIACKHRSRDQNSNFEYLKWRKAAISKIVLSSYLRRQSFDFDQIWYADVNFLSETGQLIWIVEVLHSRWQSDAIFKIGNRLHLGDNLADLREICIKDAESYADMVYMTKIAIFDAAMLKIVFRRSGICICYSCNELELSNVFQ